MAPLKVTLTNDIVIYEINTFGAILYQKYYVNITYEGEVFISGRKYMLKFRTFTLKLTFLVNTEGFFKQQKIFTRQWNTPTNSTFFLGNVKIDYLAIFSIKKPLKVKKKLKQHI